MSISWLEARWIKPQASLIWMKGDIAQGDPTLFRKLFLAALFVQLCLVNLIQEALLKPPLLLTLLKYLTLLEANLS